MTPDLFKEFCDEFIKEINRIRRGAGAERASAETELAKIKKRQRQIVDAIADGISARTLKDELMALEAREAVRSLIERIVLTPEAGKLMIDLYGEIAAILRMAAGK
jgi:hypothetical protein